MASLLLPDGVEIAYDQVGRGTAVLFLHGWATSRRVWAGQMADLAGDARLIAYDARGCGQSARPGVGYTIAQGARDALAVADALGLGRFTLVGSSLGGNVALEAAHVAPERIERLVLVDAPLHWFASGLPCAELNAWLGRLRADRFTTVEAMVPPWFGRNSSDALIRSTISQILDADWAIDGIIRDAATNDPRNLMPAVSAFTHLLHGRLDPEVPFSVSTDAAALIPRTSIKLFERCAHMPHLENRLEFSAHLELILRNGLRPEVLAR